eukprot:m51a1_g2470 putative pre-mrna-splicing factor syf1-like (915) ;mRNA; f:38499-41375
MAQPQAADPAPAAAAAVADPSQYVFAPEEEDLPYEEDVLRNPYHLKAWLRYLEFKTATSAPARVVNLIYERALRELPGSYKLWHAYLGARARQARGRCPGDAAYERANAVYERALVFMHKMPRVWLDYAAFLCEQHRVTRARRAFDRALQALPVSQHAGVWRPYVEFARGSGVQLLATRVYRRWLKYEPAGVEEYVEYLVGAGLYNEAAVRLAAALEDDAFKSARGKTKHALWLELCALVTKHPAEVTSVQAEPVIRSGLRRFSDEVGLLWTSLAEHYTRLGHWDKARDVFEEAMESVMTVKDFSMVWDAYQQFEDQLIADKTRALESPEEAGDGMSEDERKRALAELDLQAARYERLIERQPLLVNSVQLRQNRHNVFKWRERVRLYHEAGSVAEVIATYRDAIKSVDAFKATGKPHTLWTGLARYYSDELGDAETARKILARGVRQNFKAVDDLASVWCEYIELEIRTCNYQRARELCQEATTVPRDLFSSSAKPAGPDERPETARKWLHKSIKLWSLYADLEESFGTLQTTRAVYDRIFELRIATPQIVINYAHLLEEQGYFEESFRAYERGVALFNFPHAMPIWLCYLTKFVQRYGGRKLERARDLYEQVLAKVPEKEAKVFYILYANLEEEYGLARHAMAVYDRATRAVAEDDRYKMYLMYIARAGEFFGVVKTRDIYERAIQSLPDKHVRDMCMRFAALERKLGEVDRARAIYAHCSQFCSPQSDTKFWDTWRDFEVQHGNDDTYREMLRIRRSVQASMNTQVNVASAEMLAAQQAADAAAEQARGTKRGADATMEQLEREAKSDEPQAAAAAAAEDKKPSQPRRTVEFAKPAAPENPEAMDLDDEDEEEEKKDHEEGAKPKADVDLDQLKPVPAAVLSGVTEGGRGRDPDKPLIGALERLRRAGKAN